MSVGVDIPIDAAKVEFETYLWAAHDYVPYERVFGDEKDGDTFPKIHLSGAKYQDVLLNGKLDASSFFYVLPRRDQSNLEASVWIVFNVNLDKLYPSITTREEQSEQAIIDANDIISFTSFKVDSIVTGIRSIEEFVHSDKKMDMHPYFPFRFECKVNYNLSNC